MNVEVDPSVDPPLRLTDPDDFRHFKVVIRRYRERTHLAQALAGLGTLEASGDALLRIDAVKALAGERVGDANWMASFDAMVGYAARLGWVSEDGTAIRAHCELDAPDLA